MSLHRKSDDEQDLQPMSGKGGFRAAISEEQPTDSSQPLVFVIDDDESVRKSISRLLRAAGLQAEAF